MTRQKGEAMMITITTAIAALREALQFEVPSAGTLTDKLFDELALQLKRDPHFTRMRLTEIDSMTADSRRDFDRDLDAVLDRFGRRIINNFKNEILGALLNGDDELARQKVAATWTAAAEKARIAIAESTNIPGDSEISE
jgi:hypothetical protein